MNVQTLTSTKSILNEVENRMQKSLEVTRNEFHNMRTGRASVSLVEAIPVECYGTNSPLKSISSISTPDSRTVAIQPWDPSVVASVEKAILKSGLGLTPTNDGRVIRISVPSLTEERRIELDKIIRKIAEDGRIAIRNIRHEANEAVKRLEKAKTIGEDESRNVQKKIQDLTNKFVNLVDEALAKKELEIKIV